MSTTPYASLALLVRYSTDTGTPTNHQYTSHAESVTHTTLGTFTPVEGIEITMEDLTGRPDNETIQIKTPSIAPLDAVGSYASHAPVDVSLWLVDLSDIDNTDELLWQGRMTKLSVNASGRRGVYIATVAGPKRRYQDRPLGIAATSTCAWRFGDAMCGVDVAALSDSVTIQSVSGLTVTVDALTVTTADWWTRGYVQVGDLALVITEYQGGTTLTLGRPAPPTWVGATASVRPGCDKSLTGGCRKWVNEERFGGFGYAIPNADPSYRAV